MNRPRTVALFAAIVSALAAVLTTPLASQATQSTGPPLTVTGRVSHVRSTSAELDGTVNPHGLATTWYFLYGPTASLGSQTPLQTLPAAEIRQKVGQVVSGFAVGDYYLLVAYNADGYSRKGTAKPRRYEKGAEMKFELPKTLTPIVYRRAFELSGTLTGADDADVSVALQESPFPFLSPFADVGAPILTGSKGEFAFHLTGLSESGKFRVVALRPRPIYSTVLTQSVTPRIVLKVRKSATKGLVRLYGTVSPAETGVRISLQLSEAARAGSSEKTAERTTRFATQFSTVLRRGTKSMSRFSIIVTVKRGGHYRAYVRLGKSPLASGASATVTLVAAASTHTKTKSSG